MLGGDDHQSDPLLRDEFLAAGIVDSSLKSSVDTTDSEALRLVEVRNRPRVLYLSILHDQMRIGPVAVHREFHLATGLARIAAQPVELVLAESDFIEHFVTEGQNVGLVAVLAFHVYDVSPPDIRTSARGVVCQELGVGCPGWSSVPE